MMLNHNLTTMDEDEETVDPVGMAILPSTTTTSKTVSRTTGPRSVVQMMARVGMGLLLLLLVAEGAVVLPQEEAAEKTGWSNPVSSSPGRQHRVVGADRASKAVAAEEGVEVSEDGHDTTSSHRYDFAAAAGTKDGSRLHEFSRRPETTASAEEISTPRRVNYKNSKKTSQSLAESGSTSKSKTVYLIRHGNKQCRHDHYAKLCAAGVTRADHLKDVFDGKNHAIPQHLFAYYYEDPPYHAQRCYDTLYPLHKHLNNLPIHKIEEQKDKHRNVVGAEKIREYLKSSDSDVVLAAWEHEHMEEMAHELRMTPDQYNKLGHGRVKGEGKGTGPYNCDPPWPADTNFDYLYIFKYDDGYDKAPTYVHCRKQHISIPPADYHPSHTNPCLYDASDGNKKHTCY